MRRLSCGSTTCLLRTRTTSCRSSWARRHVLHPEDVADHRDRPDAAEDHDLLCRSSSRCSSCGSRLAWWSHYIVSNLVTIIQQQLIYRGLEKRGLHSREKKKS
ncbi:hypothetical protein MJ560_28150 [Klebsiella pneumoniae]|nr:hypothetical protein MJ560_28150 [Klebsiella pneumoniae]